MNIHAFNLLLVICQGLKLSAAHFDIKTLNLLTNRTVVRSKLLDELLEKGKSINIENYDLIDFDINNL